MNISLTNDQIEVSLSSFAGHIERICNKKTGLEHYWSYDPSLWPRRTSICFPICGNLTGDCYEYRGKRYELPMHGFLRERELTPVSIDDTNASFLLTADAETIKHFPFFFSFRLIYKLDGDTLIVRYIVKNMGVDSLYYSVGSHYTYRVPLVSNESYREYQYTFSGPQKAGKLILKDGRVVGITPDLFSGRDHLPLYGLFGTGSTIMRCDDLTECRIRLENPTSGHGTEVSFDGFKHVVLWAPFDGAPFACIEPWAGMIDAESDKKGLENKYAIVFLEPGATRTYTQVIHVF